MTERAVAQHCPYCAETNLWPQVEGWECRSCLRAFNVTYLGLIRPPAPTTAPPPAPGGER